MYCCQQCGRDVTAEVNTDLAAIVNGPTPGQLFGMDINGFMLHYICLSCQKKDRTPTDDKQK